MRSMTAATSLSREILWLRFSGMIIMLAGMVYGVWLGESADLVHLLRTSSLSAIVPWALHWLAAANAGVLGFVLLLAGLRGVSLRTSARARRGALVRMAAANLLFVPMAFAILQDEGALDPDAVPWYVLLPLLAGFVLTARWGIAMFRSGWKYDARSAAEVMAADPRPPVLYLRSFEVDQQLTVAGRGRAARAAGLLSYATSVSPEQELAFVLEGIGPVIAIGKPGERLPELGAARLYAADDQWREVVNRLMARAALVVIRAGETENLWWEVEQTLARCAPDRVLVVILEPVESLPAFQQRFTAAFGVPVQRADDQPGTIRRLLLRLLMPYTRAIGQIIYFHAGGTPRAEPLWFRLTWSGFLLVAFRPYRDSLQGAMRAVLAEQGIRLTSTRSLTGAVLLALGGGMVGLHHFYMGHARRGYWCLATCWTGIPLLAGWFDAVRLALLDDAGFQQRLR